MVCNKYTVYILCTAECKLNMKTQYISVGANCHPYASDANQKRNIIAYGASSMIALWHEDSVVATLKGHESVVTSVKFVSDSILVTGSQDGHIKCWKLDDDQFNAKCIQSLSIHTKSITSVACYKSLVVLCSSDGSISLLTWNPNTESLEKFDQVSINDRFIPMSLAITTIDDKFVIAVGGSSNNVFILTANADNKYSVEATLVGHENWIRGLDFKHFSGSVVLATASQDRYIRLWRISASGSRSSRDPQESNDMFFDMETTLLSNKVYNILSGSYAITFEALLMGHDDWIVSVAWDPRPDIVRLLSASSDTTLMVWEPDAESGIWMTCAQLGDVSIKGASTATGASGGFWRAMWLSCQKTQQLTVATLGKTGSWRVWQESGHNIWEPKVAISGHVKPVTDVSWSPNGEYLLSTALDQTTRLFGEWTGNSVWYEMGRPQIHGYDMLAVKSVGPSLFVSAGDEKTVRVFEEPQGVARLLENLCGISTDKSSSLAKSAMVPALGLSNRIEDDSADATLDTLSSLTHPPLENILQRQTLWPEHEKLYGHGYEISCLDVSHDQKILATCCRANNEKHAVVRLYDMANNWLQLSPPLKFHSLTVTRVRFSPDDSRLVSVSRDRHIGVWKKSSDSQQYTLEQSIKGHARIIWDCAWISNTCFATSSRDKSIKIWTLQDGTWQESAQHKFSVPVTALDCHLSSQELAIGLENGDIFVLAGTELSPIDAAICPATKINRLQWSPAKQLAVASEDTALRIYV